MLFYLIAGLLGAILASFSSVLITRLHHEEKGIFWGRSKCPKCGKVLKPWNLIPILSWIFQKGKCGACQERISARYLIIELVYFFVFIVFTEKFFGEPFFPILMAFVFVTLVAFFYDWWYHEVDLRIMTPALVGATMWAYFRPLPFEDFLLGGAIGAGFYAAQYYASKGKWVGLGDLWLGGFMGLLLGWKYVLMALLIAYIGGSIIALGLVAFKDYNRKSALPMGAFLMPALLLMLYGGDVIWEWYWDLIL